MAPKSPRKVTFTNEEDDAEEVNHEDTIEMKEHAPTNANTNENGETIWFQEEEKWELTWGIWHMLPRAERKSLAVEHGYKSIGEFEEYMNLQSAVGDSSSIQMPYDNSLIYGKNAQSPSDEKVPAQIGENEREENDNDEEDDDSLDEATELEKESAGVSDDALSPEELMETAGIILMLPDELLHAIFEWLSIDVYATLALLSPHWKHLTRTEFVYKRLCERCYLNQSKRKALHVSRFGHSYRTMLESRPRVRAGGGVYVLKYAQPRKIQRDMWTEVPWGAVLETVYYRYFYFQEDGRVLYALTSNPPHEVFPRFYKMCVTKKPDKSAVWGRYQVQKNKVTVDATQPWHSVRMELSIQTSSEYGRFNALSFDRHLSSSSANFDEYWSRDLVEYKVPHESFRFIRDRKL